VLRSIVYNEVYYDINVEEGLDPFCWECTSHVARAHNGTIPCNRDGFRFLHRWVYWKEHGTIPAVVEHSCGNKACINPAHLVGMTVEEAKRLALPAAYGRPPKSYGSMYRTSVTPEKLAEVRKMLAENESPVAIGSKLGISYRIIKGIAAGTLYTHE
jgi:hypothetical protein